MSATSRRSRAVAISSAPRRNANGASSNVFRTIPPRDLPEITTRQIAHFFEHYKDLEPGKWVRVGIWVDATEAKQEIIEGVARYRASLKPA